MIGRGDRVILSLSVIFAARRDITHVDIPYQAYPQPLNSATNKRKEISRRYAIFASRVFPYTYMYEEAHTPRWLLYDPSGGKCMVQNEWNEA